MSAYTISLVGGLHWKCPYFMVAMTAGMQGGTCQCHAAISLAGRLETAPAQRLTVLCHAYYVTSRKWAQHSTTAPQHHSTGTRTGSAVAAVATAARLLLANCKLLWCPLTPARPGWFKKYTHNFLLVLIDSVTLCTCVQRHVSQWPRVTRVARVWELSPVTSPIS